jgi:hypothetical protein
LIGYKTGRGTAEILGGTVLPSQKSVHERSKRSQLGESVMKNVRRILVPVLAMVVVAIVAYPLYAQVVGKGLAAAKDMLKIMEADKATLVKAIEAAEKHEGGGKALQAEAAIHGKDLMFEVYTVKGDKIMLVTVDGKTCKATKAEEVKELGGKPAADKKDEPKKTDNKPAGAKANNKKPDTNNKKP